MYITTCLACGELLISRRALAPLSRASGSNPAPLGSSGSGFAFDDCSACETEGVEEEDEENGGNRNGESAYARFWSVEAEAAAAAANATQDDNLEAAMDNKAKELQNV